MTFDETVNKFITDNQIKFRSGKREAFINDLKRSVQPTRDGFRSSTGQKIDLQSYMSAMMETSLYGAKPSAKETYSPGFPVRNDATKNAHRKLSETAIRKSLSHFNMVLDPSVSERVIQTLSENFIAVDDSEKVIAFTKITDSEIGSIPGKEKFSIEELLNVTASAKFIDSEATKISRLQHRAALRQLASGMAETGSKPAAIEKLVDELFLFESRALKTGMTLPYIDRSLVEKEFTKLAELEGLDRMAAMVRVRSGVSHIEDLTPIKTAISKIEEPKKNNEYQF